MQYVGRVARTVKKFYSDINPATLSGSIDIIVIEHKDGTLNSSPFHVRFGKLKLLQPSEKVVEVVVNGQVTDLKMKVGDAGEAFFVIEVEEGDNDFDSEYATSPIPYPNTTAAYVEPLDLDATDMFSARGSDDGKLYNDLKTPDDNIYSPEYPLSLDPENLPISSISLMNKYSTTEVDETVRDEKLTLKEDLPGHFYNPESGEEEKITGTAEITKTAFERTVTVQTFETSTDDSKFELEDADLKYNSIQHGDSKVIAYEGDIENPAIKGTSAPTASKVVGPVVTEIKTNYPFSDSEFDPQRDGAGNNNPTSHNYAASDDEVEYDSAHQKKQSLEQGVVSSPWSWNWGGLPKKNKQEPVLGAKKYATMSSPPNMTLNEKMDIYLSGLKDGEKFEEFRDFGDDKGDEDVIHISRCGILDIINETEMEKKEKIFNAQLITHNDIVEDPLALVRDSSIVVRIGNRYFTHPYAIPILFSKFIYSKPLPPSSLYTIYMQQQQEYQKIKQEQQPSTSYVRRVMTNWFSSTSPPRLESENVGSKEKIENILESRPEKIDEKPEPVDTSVPKKRYSKGIRLNSDQLNSLNLKKGVNTITFNVNTRYQGTASCSSKIFFWDWDSKIVISDIDGTITKSDVFGHIFHMVGKDWTHSGVASLYTNIYQNGFKIIYLTSRAIGQATLTRDYLSRVEQGEHQLPEGPMIMSPDRLFTAFHREVIMRRPEEFKIACLNDIKKLFGTSEGSVSPFYAGFGNRITDALSYRQVGVPPSRIFTIDPTGKIKLEMLTGYESSYIKLNDLVDQIFPAISNALEEFNDWSFWKAPLPDISPLLPITTAEDDEMNDAESEYEEYSDSYDSDEDMKAVQEYAYL